MIDGVLRSAVTSKKWLEHKDGEAVRQFLEDLRQSALKVCKSASLHDEVLRAQGELRVLDRYLGLPEEIRSYQENLRNKKVQPVTRTGLTLNRK